MIIRFLGACNQVGRSAFGIKVGQKYLLLDYGVIMNHDVGFPVHIQPRDVSGIVLTHAHLDHSGLVPMFYIRGRIPLYGMEPTFMLSELLIKDFLKLSSYYLPYEYMDLRAMLGHRVRKAYRQEFEVDGAKILLLNAGHIPGSCQVLVEYQGKRLLYTGDFNTNATRLLKGADIDYGDLDAIIIEGTYADEDHPDRLKVEEDFVSRAREIVERGGTVLAPAFAVGRSQEIMTALRAHGFSYPVFMDGMAREVTGIMMNYPDSLGDLDLYKRAARETEQIEKWEDRRRAIKTPSIIISPAGMLKGGAALFYIEEVAKRRQNAIFMVSYQVPGTPGRILLEKKKFIIHGKQCNVEAAVEHFDFSSHVGKKELEQTLSSLNKRTRVFVVHGAEGNCERLAEWASRELGLEASAPRAGEHTQI